MPYLGRLVILWSTSSPAHRIVLIFWQEVQSCLSAHDFYAESLGQLKGQQVPRSWWRGHPKRYFKTTKFPIFQGKVMKSRLVNQYDSPIDISKNTPYIDAQEVREGSWSFRLIWPSFFFPKCWQTSVGIPHTITHGHSIHGFLFKWTNLGRNRPTHEVSRSRSWQLCFDLWEDMASCFFCH